MENPKVDILGHIGNPQFPICIEKVIKKAKEKNKIIEVNNSSFRSRPGSEKNCKKVIELCKKYEVNIIVSSDAHVCTQIGKFDVAHELLQEISFPEELIMNTNKDKIINYLVKKNKLKDI
ncbi:putative phosphatase YcdX [compost metagenome]